MNLSIQSISQNNPDIWRKKMMQRLQLSTKICYICINFQLFCSKENSQTRTIGMIKLYAINSSKRLRYP